MTNKQIAGILKETGALVELTGGNPFRARAYNNAARVINRADVPVRDLLDKDELQSLGGIGAGLTELIREVTTTGSCTVRDELRTAVPAGVLELTLVNGLGAKKVRQLWQELDICSIDQLEEAAATGRIATLAGFGEKSQHQILEAVRLYKRYRSKRRLDLATELVSPFIERLREQEGVSSVEMAGSLRRHLEVIDHAELVVATDDFEKIREALSPWQPRMYRERDDESVFECYTEDGFPVIMYICSPSSFGTSVWYHTGSERHVSSFINRYGAPEIHASEKDVYEKKGLAYIEPELREGSDELIAANEGTLPNLVTLQDLNGSLHNHTTYSDGVDSLEKMAEAAKTMGLSYFGVCDHSRSLAIANGLSIEAVQQQQREIQSLNERFATDSSHLFRIFSGTESDILSDGSLDYPDEVLISFDFVVASVHSGFEMSLDEATNRIIRAIQNPYTAILGHATGRLLLQREGYPLDIERVLDACAEYHVAIELNANTRRLELDWRWIRDATRRGILISINPDAHAVDQLHQVYWGVRVARKGWLTPEQCLNAKPLGAFEAWVEAMRHKRKLLK